MKMITLLLLLLPPAAMAQTDWLYAPMVTACFAGGDPDCTGTAANLCMADEVDGDTTSGMVACLAAEHRVWDELLNAQYALVLDYAADIDAADQPYTPEYAVRVAQIRAAQRAWLAFRDANCTMQYGLWGGGTMRQVARADCMLMMTATQARALRSYDHMP